MVDDPAVTDFQSEKALVREFHRALDEAPGGSHARVLDAYTAPDWHWRGMHPFNERDGAEAVAAAFWDPLAAAMTRLHRRPDIFLAGQNGLEGSDSVWVVSMGHLMGLFDRPWLGIRPTGRIAMLRYAEFNRVERDRIVETAMFCDIPAVMIQAGQNPFPPQTGAHLVQPGPATHDGLMYGPQDPARGEATLATIHRMLGVMSPGVYTPQEAGGIADELAATWHEDMIWWGPAGIGATYTIPRYIEQHAGPFRRALGAERTFNGHLCRLAEGPYGGFFGWPNLTLRNAGGYLGMTSGAAPADMRVVDLYREADGLLVENWVFIDLLHYLHMQGLNVLGRLAEVQAPS